MQNKYWIYKITSPSNKIYIGMTLNIIKRFTMYKNMLCSNQLHIYNSLKKYGWDNHIKEILFISLTKKEAEEKEIELIKLHKENKNCLNIADGGLKPYKDINTQCKPVLQYDLNGNFIREWDSIISIGLHLNYSNTNIGKACRNKTFFQHGYLWIFKKDYENGIIPIYINKIGKNRCKKLLVKDLNGNIIKEYFSVTEAIKQHKFTKNPKIQIYKSLKLKKYDENKNYWEYKTN